MSDVYEIRARHDGVIYRHVPDEPGIGLWHADLRGLDLRSANLAGCGLSCANLSGADLREADLTGATLLMTDLRDADLRGAVLRGADVKDADLRNADLRAASLSADGYGIAAQLHGSNLAGARMDGADMAFAEYDHTTTFPAGYDPEGAGMLLIAARARRLGRCPECRAELRRLMGAGPVGTNHGWYWGMAALCPMCGVRLEALREPAEAEDLRRVEWSPMDDGKNAVVIRYIDPAEPKGCLAPLVRLWRRYFPPEPQRVMLPARAMASVSRDP